MKKRYIKPQTVVVRFEAEGTLMTMSTTSDGIGKISRGTMPIGENQVFNYKRNAYYTEEDWAE